MNTMKLLLLCVLLVCSDSPVAPASDPLEDIPEHYQSIPINIEGTRVFGEAAYTSVPAVGVTALPLSPDVGYSRGGGYWVGEWDPAQGWSVGWEREYRWNWNFEFGPSRHIAFKYSVVRSNRATRSGG